MTLTIAIATNHPGLHLTKTVRSIRESYGIMNAHIVVVADSFPISSQVKAKLDHYHVSYMQLKRPESQAAKLKRIISRTKTTHITLTQDDVLFDKQTLWRVIQCFESDPHATFVGAQNIPLPAKTMLEKAISVGTILNNRIARSWRGGDNYLACMGRVMAFPTTWLTSMPIPNDVTSLDAYLYFMNKKMGGKYVCTWSYPVYFRTPSTLSEHVDKSSRFQYSFEEMRGYQEFKNLPSEYAVPILLSLRALLISLITDPLSTCIYLGIFLYTKMNRRSRVESLNSTWRADVTSKQLS